ncbi:Uncharacterised protein [Legionella spiritensis]|nr:Uncharacterised protein [Legionella spiritensis]
MRDNVRRVFTCFPGTILEHETRDTAASRLPGSVNQNFLRTIFCEKTVARKEACGRIAGLMCPL